MFQGGMVVGLALLAGCTSGRATAKVSPSRAPPAANLASTAEAASTANTANADPTQGAAIIIGERLGLHSTILGEDRTLLVYRPPPDGASTRYPVVYLLDGDAHFHHVTGLIQFLISQGRMPRVMVVGLVNTDRERDFTPTRDPTIPTSGGAARFLAFLERELIPAVEAHYTTARYRVLIGHSFGGLLALHALAQRPDLFDAVIALSPSLWWGERLVQRQTESLLGSRPALDRAIYITIGGERADAVDSCRSYADLLRTRSPRGLRLRFETMDHEDHGSIVHRGVYRGLEHVFEGWAAPPSVDTLAALESYYQGLAARFRLPARIPEGQLNQLGYRLMGSGKIDDALTAFRRGVALYPDSPNAYDSLAEALERKGDHDEAIRNYELAVKHAAHNRDPRLDLYLARLDAARGRAQGRKPPP